MAQLMMIMYLIICVTQNSTVTAIDMIMLCSKLIKKIYINGIIFMVKKRVRMNWPILPITNF